MFPAPPEDVVFNIALRISSVFSLYSQPIM